MILLLVIGVVVINYASDKADRAYENYRSVVAATAQEPESPDPGAQWSYFQRVDKMSGGVIHTATVASSNTLSFRFPYNGEQHGWIILRSSLRTGNDVLLKLDRGQFICPSYEGCQVLVRFDDQPAINYDASPPADNSTDTIFIRDYGRFLEAVKKAQRVRITPNIYQEGSPVIEFDTSNFDAGKYLQAG